MVKSINETSDPSLIYKYHQKSTLKEKEQENSGVHCPYCGKPKRQMGRFFVCDCTGKNITFSSGKSIKRNLKILPKK